VISEIDSILFVEADTNYEAIPADALILVNSIKFCDGFVWVIHERCVPTVSSIIAPCQISNRPSLVIMPGFCQNKHVYSHAASESQHNIEKVTSGQNYAEFSSLKCK